MPLLIPNCKAARRHLILLGKPLQPPDRLILGTHVQQELDIALGVLVAGVDVGVVRQRRQGLVERRVHLRGGAFEELAAPADEERVAGEDGALGRRVRAVDHVVADAVLGVAGGVQRRHLDGFPDGEVGSVRWRARDGVAVLAADDGGGGEVLQDFGVAPRVVPVVVRVEDGGQVEGLGGDGRVEGGRDFGGVGRVDDHAVSGGFVGDEVGVVVRAADP